MSYQIPSTNPSKPFFSIQNIFFCKSNKKPQHVWKWRRSSYQPKKETVKVSNVQKEAISCLIFSILSPQLFLFLSLFSLIAIWRFTFQNVSNFFTIISYFFTTLGVVASDKESKRYLIAVNYALLICNWKRIHEVNENVALVVNNFFF